MIHCCGIVRTSLQNFLERVRRVIVVAVVVMLESGARKSIVLDADHGFRSLRGKLSMRAIDIRE